MGNVRNRLRLENITKYEYKKNIKQQSKLTFNAIHKTYEICDSSSFEQNAILMDQPNYSEFAALELSELLKNET